MCASRCFPPSALIQTHTHTRSNHLRTRPRPDPHLSSPLRSGETKGQGQTDEKPTHPALEHVKNIRRRLALPPPVSPAVPGGTSAATRALSTAVGGQRAEGGTGGGDAGGGAAGGGSGGGSGGSENEPPACPPRRVEITNADLAEFLRKTTPRGNPRVWARVMYRAQTNLPRAHAGSAVVERGAAGVR